MLSLRRSLQMQKPPPPPPPPPPVDLGMHRWLKGAVEPGTHGEREYSGRWACPSRWGRPRRRRNR